MKKFISVGHKNPDTDSVMSAIIISKFGKRIFGEYIDPRIYGNINNETKYILDFFKIDKPRLLKKIKKEKVVLVDTTEPSQIPSGITADNLFAAVDHHNLGGLKSSKPVYFRIEPVGSTCSVIYKILCEKNIKINKISASLMLSGIISDTINLKSPTTTNEDKKILKELNKIAKIDIKSFAKNLFHAKSSIAGIKIESLIDKDYKNFNMNGNAVGIGVWETMDSENVNSKKIGILNALLNKKKKEKLNYIFFAVIDLLKRNSYLYVIGDEEKSLATKAFGYNIEDSIMFLKDVVSRKKQIVPSIMNVLNKTDR